MLARKAQAQGGGTLGEYLVLGGFIDDDELTEFYSGKLLIPRIDPSEMSRIPPGVLRKIPADMAAEFRVVPIATDGDQNLTLAMSDPADVHAVEEVGFFSGSYVVRAAATQLQIAWCLAHYYGVVTPLAQARLLGGGPGEGADGGGKTQSATPELVIEAETGPTRAARPATLRGAEPEELRPRSGELDSRGPIPEPAKLPAVVVEEDDEDEPEPGDSGEQPILLEQRKPAGGWKDPGHSGSGEVVLLEAVKTRRRRTSRQTKPGIGDLGAVDSRRQPVHDTDISPGPPLWGGDGDDGDKGAVSGSKERRKSRGRNRGKGRATAQDRARSDAGSGSGAAAESAGSASGANGQGQSARTDAPEDTAEASSAAASSAAGARGEREGGGETRPLPGPSGGRRIDNVDEGWDVDDGWGPPGTTIPPAYLGAVPSSLASLADSGSIPLPVGDELTSENLAAENALSTDQAATDGGVAAPPEESVDPEELAADMERSSNRLLETVRKLERAAGRDDIIDILLDHVGQVAKRRGFFAIRGGVLFPFRQYGAARVGVGEAELALDKPSTFAQVALGRMPFRGTVSPAAREFVEEVMGSAPADALAVVVPVVVRGRAVGLVYGDGIGARVFDEHQMLLGRAAGQALERILTSQKRS